jgi:hypothetical protein
MAHRPPVASLACRREPAVVDVAVGERTGHVVDAVEVGVVPVMLVRDRYMQRVVEIVTP